MSITLCGREIRWHVVRWVGFCRLGAGVWIHEGGEVLFKVDIGLCTSAET
jgi:hypothetical protein